MKQKPLSTLEQEVMNIIWECEKCSVRDVLAKLQRNRQIAYSTVATIFRRLENKNIITKNTKAMTFTYSSKVSKEKYSQGLASTFVKNFVKSFGNTAMSSFVVSLDELPKEKKDYFLKLLEEHDKNK